MTSYSKNIKKPQKNNDSNKSEVVILGAGLSGMITALSLSQIGKKVRIIEAKSIDNDSFFADPRSTAITGSSKSHFQAIGIWDEINKIAGPIKDIYVVDNKSPEMIHFDSNDINESSSNDSADNQYMGYLVLNKEFKKLLLKLIQKDKNIILEDKTIYHHISNTENNCILELSDNRKIICEMLVVCDGKNSPAKSRFFSEEIQRDYRQQAMTFIVEHELDHNGTAVEHFLHSGPFAILPLKNPHQSSIVWTCTNEIAEAVISLPDDEFTFMVQDNFGEFLGKIKINDRPKLFPLQARMTSRYVNKRAVLVADTAHVIHPLAGQGLNQGIKDISQLVELISSQDISLSVLDKYESARKSDNHNMLEITDTINAIFSSDSKVIQAGRKAGFEIVEKISPFKKVLMKYAMGRRK